MDKLLYLEGEEAERFIEAISDDFADVSKTIQMPKGTTKIVPDFMLTNDNKTYV